MATFNYGGNPQHPVPNQYPVLPGQPGYGAPGQPGYPVPGQSGFPVPGQPGYPAPGQQGYPAPGQPGFAYPYPGQQGQAPPSNYPNITPTAPTSFGYPSVTPQTNYGPAVEWITSNVNDAHLLSDRAVVGGYEGHDHSPLWVIRARYQGDVIPGKLAIKHRSAYVAWNGTENAVHTFEVCCARPEKVRWVKTQDGICPPNAVVGGNTSSGEPLYVGRTQEQGSLTPGKVHPSHKVLYISFAGREMPHKFYETLCTV